MLRRKSERERAKLEREELTRRLAAGEPVKSPKAEQLLEEYKRARDAVQRGYELPAATGVEPAACEKHSHWRPTKRWWQPRPSASSCPYCVEEHDIRPVGPPVFIGGGVPTRRPTPRMTEAWAAHREERRAAGELLAGSDEESDVVAYMDDKRRETLRLERGQTGRFICNRIIDGVLTPIYAPSRPRRRGATSTPGDGRAAFHIKV